MKKAGIFVLFGILLLGWVASLLVREPSQSDVVTSLVGVQEPVFVGEAKSSIVAEEGGVDDEEMPVIDKAQVEAGHEVEETSRDSVVTRESNGQFAHETLDSTHIGLKELEDAET